MATTFTADMAHSYSQPRENATGITTVRTVHVNNGTSVSATDVILFAKIPNQSTILSIKSFGKTPTTSTFFDLGTSGSPSLFGQVTYVTADAYADIQDASTVLPHKVSVTDNAVQYITLQGVAGAGSSCATGTFGLVITYGRPGTV